MTDRVVDVRGRKVQVAELGSGPPVVYLHGFADVHGAQQDWLPFHRALAQKCTLIAPAFPGCAGTDEDPGIEGAEDVAFHTLEVLDALDLGEVTLVGTCIGGWVAAEMAVRYRERISKLVLIGATGLFVPGKPIGDIFWEVQPVDGTLFTGLRRLLFADENVAAGKAMFPDARLDVDTELLRYKMFRFASRIGFKPPYLHDRRLKDRLYRYDRPALVLAGENENMVPLDHAIAYSAQMAKSTLVLIPGAGHSP
ncbi:MAG: alpha/beta fold hydrolase, partial [Rhodospirillales bacterium]